MQNSFSTLISLPRQWHKEKRGVPRLYFDSGIVVLELKTLKNKPPPRT
jgi:hypothetical protein